MATTALFSVDDLNALPGVDGVTDAEAVAVEAIVWGWLKPVLTLTERPDPVSDELFSWALELGAIYRANPEGLDSKKSGPFGEDYSPERRQAILRSAATGGVTPSGTALKPTSSFPRARAYPDPAERCW